MAEPSRRAFLAGVGGTIGIQSLSGCLGSPFPGTSGQPDITIYVGAYHWGFVVFDDNGAEHEEIILDPGPRVRIIAFNTGAAEAISRLPQSVQSALPDHEALEERNGERIPEPPSRDMHEALEEANERYPDHSLAIVPSGDNHMRGPMGGGMMLNSILLPHDASRPATAGIVASQRGDYTISCLTYCGYGHPFMELDGAFVVR